jgi:hypothetical protein
MGGGLEASAALAACNIGGLTLGAATASPASPVEPGAGRWKTWVLASGSQFRPGPPPGSDGTQREIGDLRALAGVLVAERVPGDNAQPTSGSMATAVPYMR